MPDIVLYHASPKPRVVGEVVSPAMGAVHAKRAAMRGLNWANQLIDEVRPDGLPARSIAVFAFPRLAWCAAYARGEKWDERWFYKVRLSKPVAVAPFTLVDHLTRRLGQSDGRCPEVAQAYWRNDQGWKFVEHFSTSMTILEEVERPEFAFAPQEHMDDVDLAKRLWPSP